MKIDLTHDEALVLLEWLYERNNKEDIPERCFKHIGEKMVLWNLECLLEAIVPDVFMEDYETRVQKARERLGAKIEESFNC